ncbi:MAG: hypothetical protein IT196_19075 [Acidimicrobiales bacterium]|nr:hypothetical protein [Acidimicrobiales bacterium]
MSLLHPEAPTGSEPGSNAATEQVPETAAAPQRALLGGSVRPIELPIAVIGAGVVAQAVGLAGRFLGDAGTAVHDGGGALIVAGWVVTLAGLLWQCRRPALGIGAAAVALALAGGVLIGRGGDDGPLDPPVATVPSTTAPVATVPATIAAGASTTTVDPATPTSKSLGQILADQGAGSNSPPPSIPGVSFPVEAGRDTAGAGAPWTPMPVTPATALTEQPATTTTPTNDTNTPTTTGAGS